MSFYRTGIFLSLLLQASLLNAQQTLLQYDLDENKQWQANAKLSFSSDKVLATLVYATGIERFVLKNDSIIKQSSQETINTNDNSKQQGYVLKKDLENIQLPYMSGFLNGDTLVECNYAKAKKELYFTETILSGAVTTTADTLFISKEENLLVVTAMQNTLYIICSVEETDKLNIYVKRNGEKIKSFEKTIPFSSPAEKDKKKSKVFADYFSTKGNRKYFVFEKHTSYLSNISSIKNKIYPQDGKIVFSIENSIYETYLITLNLSNFAHTVRKYPSLPDITIVNEDPADFVNSYVRDSFLCKAGVFQDVFFLQLFNLSTNDIIYNTYIKASDKKAIAEALFFTSGSFKKQGSNSPERIMKLLKNEYFYLLFDKADSNKCNISLQFYAKATLDYTFGIAPISLTTDSDAIQNSIDYKTGQVTGVSSNNKPLNIRLAELKYFIEQNTVEASEPGIYIYDGSIYASCVDKGGGKFYVYKF
ncbi:MAG: hypothetical protein V4685_12525 [Bacteroidota bacterium]